uniref:Cytochrome P450 3075A1 n=1 Tax=Paracyclopina nana TaxID=565004 RepID=A0A0F7DGX9_PARNA|nr:cytochrome P450 3075A1 [Paracyclopina nana]
MWLLWFIVFLASLAYLLKKKMTKPANFPPGPPIYPFVGSIPYLNPPNESKPKLFWAIRQFEKKYGSIFGFFLADSSTVVLTEYNDIKDIMGREETALRPPVAGHKIRPGWEASAELDPVLNARQSAGVAFSNGNFWKEQRRYLLKNLRDFGFGKASMEEALHEEVQKLVDFLKPLDGKVTNLSQVTNISILNALWNILVGEKLDLDDPRLEKLLKVVDNLLRLTEGPNSVIGNLLPHPDMIYWPGIRQLANLDIPEQTFKTVFSFIQPYVDEHKKTLDEENVRDFMDLFLLEIRKTTDPMSSFYGKRGENALINDLMDMFIAGMETTSSSLLWSFLFLLHFPECQAKIYEEIARVVGLNKLPGLQDQKDLHYLNAFVQESFRFASLVPMSLFHYTSAAIDFKGYTIPKNSIVIGSLFHVMHDPKHFANPEEFSPERFLDKNGIFVHDERIVPFGIGKRFCLGKSLAEKEFFLFFSGFMQNFEVLPEPGVKLPPIGVDEVNVNGIIRSVPTYQLVLRARK